MTEPMSSRNKAEDITSEPLDTRRISKKCVKDGAHLTVLTVFSQKTEMLQSTSMKFGRLNYWLNLYRLIALKEIKFVILQVFKRKFQSQILLLKISPKH